MNRRISPPVAYVASVAVDKGFSVIAIPLLASYLAPASYGRLDVAVSLIESIGLVMSFGMADTLVRFAGGDSSSLERRRCMAELLACALLMTLTIGTAIQLAAPWLAATFNISISVQALRWGLLGATLSALIELPLMWLRLRNRAGLFLLTIGARSVIQISTMWLVLPAGLGAEGIIVANGATMLFLAAVLAIWQFAETGIAWSYVALRRIAHYGLPLVLASLAMFALGSCNRLFLSGQVPDQEIAFLGLATKLALAAPLLFQPFNLWWIAKRFKVLAQPNGLEESAKAWALGYSMLIMSALGVCLAGPVFIEMAFPPSYAEASAYLPFVVAICVMNELNTLCNTGTYARDNGLGVLAANGAGALLAIAGYMLLIPLYGVPGVLAAMLAGHSLRLTIFLKSGRELAPIPYPFAAAIAVSIFAVAAVVVAPPASDIVARALWSVPAVIFTGAAMIGLRLAPVPAILENMARRRMADAGILKS